MMMRMVMMMVVAMVVVEMEADESDDEMMKREVPMRMGDRLLLLLINVL